MLSQLQTCQNFKCLVNVFFRIASQYNFKYFVIHRIYSLRMLSLFYVADMYIFQYLLYTVCLPTTFITSIIYIVLNIKCTQHANKSFHCLLVVTVFQFISTVLLNATITNILRKYISRRKVHSRFTFLLLISVFIDLPLQKY